jgi:hypothetical protein
MAFGQTGVSMNSRADKFLEGFKLGKLGAGKAKLGSPDLEYFPEESPFEKIKILKRVIGKTPDDQFRIFWKDRDDHAYYIDKFSRKDWGDKFMLWLKGQWSGKKTTWSVSMRSDLFVNVQEMFQIFLSEIQERGVRYFLNLYSKGQLTFGPSDDEFKKWLEHKIR